ncbi:unnamed protein product [Rotaria sp. Silwood2]|nr:unnamed protein product [Rotaria sp. Silwood2]CAF4372970.1 unnamed protein product [Rotaria sp. Silwood2]
MPKRKHNKFNNSKRIRSSNTSTADNECERNITDVTNISLQSNDEDFLDNNIKMTLNKRKKHLKNFYDRTKTAPGTFDGEDNIFNDLIETSTTASTKKKVSIDANLCQTIQSDSSVEDGFPSATRTLTTTSRDPHLLSSSLTDNINVCRGKNQSLLTTENHPSDSYLFGARSSSIVVDNQHHHSSLTQQSIDENEKQILTPKDHTTVDTCCHRSQCFYFFTFNIYRSIIRLPNVTSQAHANRPSTNIVAQIRTIDVLHSIEYRELEEKNKKLLTQVDNLKQAIKKMRKERKKFEETHMLKPRASLYNELRLFLDLNSDIYKGDGRTIEEIGSALGLSSMAIHQVQQDAEKPDKIAMNVWRKICPTQEDRIYVGTIKQVPKSTVQNIYMFARLCLPNMNLNFKKMRNDIATNLRQGRFNPKSTANMSSNYTETQQNNQSDDENEDDMSDAEETTDLESFLKEKNLINYISDDE